MLGASAARSFFGALADFLEELSPSFEDTHIHTLTDCESIHTLNNAVRIYLCRHMLTVHIYTPPWVSLYKYNRRSARFPRREGGTIGVLTFMGVTVLLAQFVYY